MRCPKCDGRIRTIATKNEPLNRVMRWRKCRECGHTFPTFELTARDLTKELTNK